ncbi:MAG: SURF1 family protein [Pseudomonadales bacterium]
MTLVSITKGARLMMTGRKFTLNWKVTLFTFVFMVVFVQLGFWQLSRADEKRALLAQRAERQSLSPVSAAELLDRQETDRLVQLNGEYDAAVIYLLDNRVLDGIVGFEVVQQFFDKPSGSAFFVNRGFAKMGRTRDDLPTVATPEGQVILLASVYAPSAKPLVLAASEPMANNGYPRIIQDLDELPYPSSFNMTLRLQADSPGALPRHWPATSMSHQTHSGYAFQWFAMAVALVLIWLYFSFPKAEGDSQ